MRCFGSFKDDRTCDLCEMQNKTYHTTCKEKYEISQKHIKKIKNIRRNCPHLGQCFDKEDEYWRCNNEERVKYCKSIPLCKPTLECEKYYKEGDER